jgi:cell wall-associated NlpC family hydrolase
MLKKFFLFFTFLVFSLANSHLAFANTKKVKHTVKTRHHSIAHKKTSTKHSTVKSSVKSPVEPQIQKSVIVTKTPIQTLPITKASQVKVKKSSWRNHFHNPHLIRRSIDFASTTEHNIVGLVHNAVMSLHHTVYRYGGNYFNMAKGVYEVDCSDYVDDLLRISDPKAYQDLANSTHTEKPTSRDYYNFFNDLPDNSGHAWQRVDDVEALKPGDILVFQNRSYGGGHVMVVMDTPSPSTYDTNTYFVKVSDSASSRHSDDTRARHASGIGIGTLMLKADPQTGEPSAYAWTVDSGWEQNVDVAMAEPVNT